MKKLLLSLLITVVSLSSFSQTKKQRTYHFSGYIKYLQTDDFSGGLDSIITSNLIHHRLNFKWYPVKPLLLDVEIRNRIYFGELVKLTNSFGQIFGDLIENDDIYDMSILVIDRRAIVWDAMIDRAFLRYSKNKWEATLGRQRINWGMTLIWNPNDIFNAYSFYDFDYEERPGSDAARVAFYPNSTSSVEVAGKIATEKEEVVSALYYKWNKAKYDFQTFAGVMQQDIVAGGGLSGNIKNAGVKGEFTIFHPYKNFADTATVFAGTVSLDYSFKNNLYLNGSFLYTSNGNNHADFSYISSLRLSAKTLSPYRYNIFVQTVYPFTPILNGALAVLYSPGEDHALFINPVLTYNIKEDWDIDVVGQLFLSKSSDKYRDVAELLFLRLRWSY